MTEIYPDCTYGRNYQLFRFTVSFKQMATLLIVLQNTVKFIYSASRPIQIQRAFPFIHMAGICCNTRTIQKKTVRPTQQTASALLIATDSELVKYKRIDRTDYLTIAVRLQLRWTLRNRGFLLYYQRFRVNRLIRSFGYISSFGQRVLDRVQTFLKSTHISLQDIFTQNVYVRCPHVCTKRRASRY